MLLLRFRKRSRIQTLKTFFSPERTTPPSELFFPPRPPIQPLYPLTHRTKLSAKNQVVILATPRSKDRAPLLGPAIRMAHTGRLPDPNPISNSRLSRLTRIKSRCYSFFL
jgi:hypothetical protein